MRSLILPLLSVWMLVAGLVLPLTAQQNVHTFLYDPATGNLSLDNNGLSITALEIRSAAGYFTGTRPSLLKGLFDVYQPSRMFWLFPAGFDDVDFGPVLTPGLTDSMLQTDLVIAGALRPQGPLGQVNIIANTFTPNILHYDSVTGAMSFEQPDDPSLVKRLTSIVIDSASGIFTGQRPATLTNDFDVFRENRLFKMDLSAIEEVDFGTPSATGWADATLAKDLCIGGSVLGGGKLSGVRLNSASGPLIRTCDTRPNIGGDAPPPSYVYVTYSSLDGRLVVSTSGSSMTALEIIAPGNLFTGPRPSSLNGPSDIYASDRIYKLNTNGFPFLEFASAMAPGLAESQVLGMQVSVSLSADAAFEDVPVYIFYYVPEPNTITLLGLLGAIVLRSVRRCRVSI